MSDSQSSKPDLAAQARDELAGRGVRRALRAETGEGPGDVIGPYQLIEKIGEGGMGSVWLAHQSDPVERDVALKIVKLGMDTREVIARFDLERRVLALMDHPHIAHLFDGGATETGRPYFVMEVVQGVPITNYCKEQQLDLTARLELFAKVCLAVQHAHHKGIIHRDLKPSNVLVTTREERPSPKVIDFGIAKATRAAADRGVSTLQGHLIGTPEYMAPEQTFGNGFDIDTRVDVYALGVVLYELLTDHVPFELEGGRHRSFDELLRAVREDDAPTPSMRVRTGSQAPVLGDSPRSTPPSAFLKGDLDRIVLKALEKEPTRRYETTKALADDIHQFLRGEPVSATPTSFVYRLTKLIRRRRKTVLAAGLLLFSWVAGSVGTGVNWWRTKLANEKLTRALRAERTALDEQAREAQRASKAEAEALQRSEELKRTTHFQASQLAGIDAHLMGSRLRRSIIEGAPEGEREALRRAISGLNFTNLALGVLTENIFDRSLQAIDEGFEHQPLTQANLLEAVAENLRNLGLVDTALEPQERALAIRRAAYGDDDPRTLSSGSVVGQLLLDRGEISAAEPFFRDALRLREILGPQDPMALQATNNMASLYYSKGQPDEAEKYIRMALEGRTRLLGEKHEDTLFTLGQLGLNLQVQGRYKEAESTLSLALEGQTTALGGDHKDTLLTRNNLGGLYMRQSRLSEAEVHMKAVLEARRRTLGEEHHDTLVSLANWVNVLAGQQRGDSIALQREVLEKTLSALGPAHQHSLSAMNNLATLLHERDPAEAESLYRQSLEGTRRALGNDHPDTLHSLRNLGRFARQRGNLTEAERCAREAFEGSQRVLGTTHPETAIDRQDLGGVLSERVHAARSRGDGTALATRLARQGRFQRLHGDEFKAVEVLSEALELLENSTSASWERWGVQVELGSALVRLGEHAEGELVMLEAIDFLLEFTPRDETKAVALADSLDQVVELYQAWDKAAPNQGHDLSAGKWRERRRSMDGAR